jgi:FdhD protein/molybdopterin-guanine dinucleotide biosynthesis protein A
MSIEKNSGPGFKPLIKGVTGVILAGGKSSRFGSNKAFAEFNGTPLIERVIAILGSIFESLILITNSPEEFSYLRLPIHEDPIKGLGPIGGIYAGLEAMRDEIGFFVACDMPFINRNLVRHMVAVRNDFDAVVPKIDWKVEPLHALYAKNCLPPILELIREGSYQTIKSFNSIRVRYVTEDEIRAIDPEVQSFMNVNRPDELLDAISLEGESD